jgi:phage terminase large subunit-like protein
VREVEPLVDAVEARPSVRPTRVHTVTPRQSKRVRAEAVTGLYELGRAHHLGRLAELEFEMTT